MKDPAATRSGQNFLQERPMVTSMPTVEIKKLPAMSSTRIAEILCEPGSTLPNQEDCRVAIWDPQ